MTSKVAEIRALFTPEAEAAWVSQLWDTYNNQRASKMADWQEVKQYLFATDTSTTSNKTLPWKNSTTLPKLTQIRDNLHSNYFSALFPNDKWLRWQAYSKDDAKRKKAKAITAYVENKSRMSGLRTEVSKMLYDYIDYGNAFSTVIYERRYNTMKDGTKVASYIGPRAVRVSPEDIVFNPLAMSFEDSFKVVRSTKTIGELKLLAERDPDQAFWRKALDHREKWRNAASGFTKEEFNKAAQYSIDGFGNLHEYYMSGYVEILEFWGDYHDHATGEIMENRVITIVDRSVVVRNEPIPTYSGRAPIWHVGWRFRPDNLWAMGPLDNLVGMQYRIDHLENLKADAMDLIVHPPLKIIGEVEEFVWAPGAEIHIDENGDVAPVSTELNSIIIAENQIQQLMDTMELMAGAPREAMGVRSPGEKTAFEVQTLDNAAGRIFQEKSTTFEVELLEKVLNGMLESAKRNMGDGVDTISSLDNDLGAQEFMSVTVKDITANGVIRPIGARHFAQQATELQNLIGVANSPIWQMVAPHVSGENMAKFVEDIVALEGYNIFRPNVAIEEAQKSQGLMNQASEDMEVAATMPTETQRLPPEKVM